MTSSLENYFHRLVSTSGYVVVDDTHHPQFDDSEWPWVVNQTFPQPDPSSCTKVEPTKVNFYYLKLCVYKGEWWILM